MQVLYDKMCFISMLKCVFKNKRLIHNILCDINNNRVNPLFREESNGVNPLF